MGSQKQRKGREASETTGPSISAPGWPGCPFTVHSLQILAGSLIILYEDATPMYIIKSLRVNLT